RNYRQVSRKANDLPDVPWFHLPRRMMMDLGMGGQTALVTGASKGIGLAVAESLAAEGCHLHLVARGADGLSRAADAIRRRHQVTVTPHPMDLAAPGAAERLAAECGEVDIVVNNAGAIPGGSLDAVDEA